MSSLLVIGGTGFFGKSILDGFQRSLLRPFGIDHLLIASRHASALANTHPELMAPGVELHDLDIATTDQLPTADLVLHAAVSSDAARYAAQSEAEHDNIVRGAANFTRLIQASPLLPRVVYTSSGAVYGAQAPTQAFLEEGDVQTPIEDVAPGKRAYTQGKRAAEQILQGLAAEGHHVAIARCFAFVGKYLPRDRHFAIGNFFADGLAGRPIVVQARRPVVRSYMYADDLVRWLAALFELASPQCPVINVGSDEAVLVQELATRVGLLFGVPAEVPALSDEPADRYVPSIARAQQAFGLQLDYDLAAALAATRAAIRAPGCGA